MNAGTFACPICGYDKPHHHTTDDIQRHRALQQELLDAAQEREHILLKCGCGQRSWIARGEVRGRPLFCPACKCEISQAA